MMMMMMTLMIEKTTIMMMMNRVMRLIMMMMMMMMMMRRRRMYHIREHASQGKVQKPNGEKYVGQIGRKREYLCLCYATMFCYSLLSPV